MKLASTLAWRSLASRPARSFTAALGIGVGIATVLSVQVVDHNTILTQQMQAVGETLGQPDVEIRPVAAHLPDGGAAPLDVARDRDVEAFCGYFYERAELLRGAAAGADLAASDETPSADPRLSPDVTVVGIGPLAAPVFGAYSITEGRDFASATADELLLPE